MLGAPPSKGFTSENLAHFHRPNCPKLGSEFYMNLDPSEVGTKRLAVPFLLLSLTFY